MLVVLLFALGAPALPAALAQGPQGDDSYGDPLLPGTLRRFGTVRFRDGNTFFFKPAFTPDGKMIVTTNGALMISIWEADSGKLRRRFLPGRGLVSSLAVSSDGERVAAAGNNGVTVHKVRTGEQVALLECAETNRPTSLAFSPDGSRLAFGAQSSITVWETGTWRQILRREDVGMNHLVVDYTPDGVFRAARAHLRELRLWDSGGMRSPIPHKSVIEDVAFSRDGLWVASVERAGQAHVWSVGTGREARAVETPPDTFPKIAISPDGSRFAVASAATLRIYDVKNPDRPREISLPVDLPRALVLSPDGRIACVETNHALHLFRLDDGARIGPRREEIGSLDSIALSADERVLATQGHEIAFWDIETGKRIQTIASGEAFAGADRAFFFDEKSGVQAWDVKRGEKIDTPLSGSLLGKMQLSPDGSRLAGVARDGGVWIVNVATGTRLAAVGGRERSVEALSFSADGRHLAESSIESVADTGRSVVRLYQTLTGAAEAELRGGSSPITTVACSPDGRVVIYGDYEGNVRLWRPGSDSPPLMLGKHTGPAMATAFSGDGLLAASGGADGKILLWDLGSARPLATLTGHDGPVTGVRFLSDGMRMVSASADTTALLWDLGAALDADRATPIDWDAAWQALARPEGAKLIWPCARAGKQAVKEFSRKLAPVTEAEIQKLIRRLDSDEVAVRETAMRELQDIGPRYEDILVRARAGASPEGKSRLEALLEEIKAPIPSMPEQLRWIRAAAILERAGTPEARELLGSMGTRASREALDRLKARAASK